MKKAAIYVRVSTGQQAEEGHSLQNQKDACTEYAETHDLQVVKVYEDAGVSGTTDDRPEMQKALKESDGFEHLVIYDSSRLGRTQDVNSGLRALFTKAGVTIHSVNEGGALQPNTQMAIWMTAVMDARAASENLDRSTKSRSGKYSAVKAGNLQIGNPPFGYDLIRKGMNARGKGGKSVLIINQAQAVGVRKAFKLFNQGKSIGEIFRQLQKARIKKPNGKKWTRENVKDMLERETYAGKWTYGKTQSFKDDRARKSVSVKVPKIITPAVYKNAQVQLKANSKKNSNAVKHSYLLRGRIECSQCRQVYVARAQSRKDKNGKVNRNFYYQHKPKADHQTRNLKRDDIELRVADFIDTALQSPKTFVKLLGDQSDDTEAVNKADLKRNQKAQEKIRGHRANSLQMLVEKAITKEDWAGLDAKYKAQLEPLEAEEKNLIEDQQVDPIEIQGYEQMLRDQEAHLAEGGKATDFGMKRSDYSFYIEAMDLRIEVSPKAERVSASALGIANTLLPNVTDQKTAPASC